MRKALVVVTAVLVVEDVVVAETGFVKASLALRYLNHPLRHHRHSHLHSNVLYYH